MASKVRKVRYHGHWCSIAQKVITPEGGKLLVIEELLLPDERHATFTDRGPFFADSTVQLVQLLRAHFDADRVLIANTTTL